MTSRSSRTYKLRLSDEGVDFFLSCHCRLAHLVQDFIPYGTTLHVAVLLLCHVEISDLLADLSEQEGSKFTGGITHYVGTSQAVNGMTSALVNRLEASGELASAPPLRILYIQALIALRDASDEDVLAAYRRATHPQVQAGKGIPP